MESQAGQGMTCHHLCEIKYFSTITFSEYCGPDSVPCHGDNFLNPMESK